MVLIIAFENIAFVNCNIGFYQQPLVPYVDLDTSSYVDKTMFYQSQFINCNTAFSIATRANNLNAWVDCKFDGGGKLFACFSKWSSLQDVISQIILELMLYVLILFLYIVVIFTIILHLHYQGSWNKY
jgi:hypothetical protein